MQKGFKGNNRYLKTKSFNFGLEAERPEFEKEFNTELAIADFEDFLDRDCLERLREVEDIFGLAYTSSSSFALITLDTNNYIFIDDYYYMTYLAVGEDGETYLVCSCIESEDEVIFKIS